MDIKEIKKLKSYQIAYNENYICYMGSRLVVHDRQENEVCTFSDMRNYGWVDFFKGHYLVARNGGCTFKVYDLRKKMCVKTYQVFGRQYLPYGRPVLDKKALIVYEAFFAGAHFETKKIACLNVETGECQYIDFPYDGTPGMDGRINAEGDYSFIYVRLDNGHPYVEIGYLKDGMLTFQGFHNRLYGGVTFWTDDFLILHNNELFWLNTEKRVQLNVSPQSERDITSGIYFTETGKLLSTYPNGVCLMDIGRNECEFFYPEEYVSDVKIIGDDLYIGTWVKTVCLKGFKQEVLDKD
ncbi:MAG: hypothetical protein PUJ55_01965 [Clostridiales bacterium]|nr:hypothetical protein [Clostridiales bacterium]MDY4112063.1 hypothetical protein [Roseburia sp.]